jgi:hypothetical protein
MPQISRLKTLVMQQVGLLSAEIPLFSYWSSIGA